jgi:hypothetical protein
MRQQRDGKRRRCLTDVEDKSNCPWFAVYLICSVLGRHRQLKACVFGSCRRDPPLEVEVSDGSIPNNLISMAVSGMMVSSCNEPAT